MWIDNEVFHEDMEYISKANFIDWEQLEEKIIFVTGATGLIGFYFCNALLYHNLKEDTNIKILMLVRDLNKAKCMYSSQIEEIGEKNIEFIEGTMEKLPPIAQKIDYIFHGASPTASDFFLNYPVETIKTSILGSINILNLAMKKKVKGLIYLSSMEVYGNHGQEDEINEQENSYLNALNIRDCYPISKCLIENLNNAYAKEYKVPVSNLRISQVIGTMQNPLKSEDKRLTMELLRCLLEKRDIILNTKGDSKRTYIYISDVITAILTVFVHSCPRRTFNIANEKTYCSVYELCKSVVGKLGNGQVRVQIHEKNLSKYPKTNFLNLSSKRLRELGWKPSKNIDEMFLSLLKQSK